MNDKEIDLSELILPRVNKIQTSVSKIRQYDEITYNEGHLLIGGHAVGKLDEIKDRGCDDSAVVAYYLELKIEVREMDDLLNKIERKKHRSINDRVNCVVYAGRICELANKIAQCMKTGEKTSAQPPGFA